MTPANKEGVVQVTPEMVERLRELLAKATPGPWRAEPSCDEDENVYWSEDLNAPIWTVATPLTNETATWLIDHIREADAALIVEAVNALPALLATRPNDDLVKELVEALRPFAKAGELFDNEPVDPRWQVSIYKPAAGPEFGITDRHLRAARAALAKAEALS